MFEVHYFLVLWDLRVSLLIFREVKLHFLLGLLSVVLTLHLLPESVAIELRKQSSGAGLYLFSLKIVYK
jgi:hypothetical protein